MFFLFTVYLKKAIPPSKISTKLKEMQISYDLFQAQHRQKIHTHYFGVSCWFSFHSFKAVVSTGQFRDKKHGPWQFVLQLRFVLWECLTSFPEISAFLVQNSKGWDGTLGLFLAQDWFLAGALSSGPCSHFGATVPFSSFLGLYSKVIKFVGTCCLLLWQAALRCLNHSVAFILLPAWNLYEFPFSESVSRKRSGWCGSSAIITIHPTTDTFLLDVDLKCFLSVAFRDLAA